MIRIPIVAAVLVAGIAVAAAQDTETALPEAYTLQFENEWVKVVRVRYAPHVKLPEHAHTRMASAYVYLTDAGPVVFRHVGAEYASVTRPPVTAGTFRLFRAVGETHEVENTSELLSEFLRVEFKTEPKDEQTLRGRYHREAVPDGENRESVQFENAQIRVTRLVIAPARTFDLATGPAEPTLVITLSPTPGRLDSGHEHWIPQNQVERLTNTNNGPIELLRFDFKTPPIRSATP